MNFNENFVIGSTPLQGVQSAEAESYLRPKSENARNKNKPASPTLDWVSLKAGASNEREQQRLQRLEREFVDRLIVAYERAVEDGLPPNTAIASMLEWVSRECPRLLP
jgi:hypothetical protein